MPTSYRVRVRPSPSLRADRRGLSFCYTMIVVGAMLVLGLVFMQIGLNSAKWAYSDYRDQQALCLAEAAVDRACWMMEQSPSGEAGINDALGLANGQVTGGSFQSNDFAMPTGTYSFTAISPYNGVAGTIEVRAKGVAKGGKSVEDVRTVLVPDTWSNEHPLPYATHPIFSYVMFSDHNLPVKGGPQVIAHTEAGGSGLFANGNIKFEGTTSVVHGPIISGGSVIGTTTQVPADAGIVEGHRHVQMPPLDLAYYRDPSNFAVGNHEYHVAPAGGLTWTNGHNAGASTFDEPKVIFVEGKVKIAGSWEGVGVLVASDGIEVTGNVTYGSPDSSWAFLTSGSFAISGTSQIHGLVYCHSAEGDAQFIGTGTPNIFGSIVADIITMRGDYTTEYDGMPRQISALPGTVRNQGPPVIETILWEKI